ncbi:MAG: LysM peptidoglycan-binding domain-containing protein [Gammaproteobacteria bacterium]|nr:LysM peptidoglycan-binding domain-containing protein [Gammaproteobacteria bacterium]
MVLLLATLLPAAPEAQVREDQPGVYVVQQGDTLWDIARVFLDEPWRWPDLWRVNPEIENPHLIYPGDVVRLRWIDGEPGLVLERGEPSRTMRAVPGDVTRLQPRIRYEPLVSAIPSINLEAVGPFLSSNRVVRPRQLENAPYVVQGDSGRLLTGAGDRMYVRGRDLGEVGDAYSVVRRATNLIDPDSGELLGLEAEEIGAARTISLAGDIATMTVTSSREDIRIGDRILPMEARALDPTFFPSAPTNTVSGRILKVLGGVSQVGSLSVVVLNIGQREGLEVGNVLSIHQQGALVRDRERNEQIRLPSEEAGLLMVFRVFERVAYGIVLEARRPLAVLDEVRNP